MCAQEALNKQQLVSLIKTGLGHVSAVLTASRPSSAAPATFVSSYDSCESPLLDCKLHEGKEPHDTTAARELLLILICHT